MEHEFGEGEIRMKAVVFYEHGGVDKLRYEERPDPLMKDNEVLVRVRACALNHLDIWGRVGLPSVQIPLPHISGNDISGEVVNTGRLVTRTRAGDAVIISPGLSCGMCEYCLSGRDSMCRSYKIIGYLVDGGYAELVSVPEVNIIRMPEWLKPEEAAAIPLVFMTAWHMLVTRAGVSPGEHVLVLGAGSGVGSAAIQIAKLWGARVIATAGSEEKLKLAKTLGADELINHNEQDIAAEARRITEKRGVDVVFEHVGSATWEKSIKSLAVGGRLITCGATSGYVGQTDIRYLYSRQLSILGSYMASKAELLKVIELVRQRRLKPVVDSVYPLAEAAKAQERMERREHFGKIVLRP
jgi:NADPH:quinone reductase-like Zn-dependent oxidoreductase